MFFCKFGLNRRKHPVNAGVNRISERLAEGRLRRR
jgi:hypothetical protein